LEVPGSSPTGKQQKIKNLKKSNNLFRKARRKQYNRAKKEMAAKVRKKRMSGGNGSDWEDNRQNFGIWTSEWAKGGESDNFQTQKSNQLN